MSRIADNPRIEEMELAALNAAKERLPQSLAVIPA